MIFFRNTCDFFLPSASAVTLGKFDGVHKGHLKLMDRILDKRKEGLLASVFAIDARGGQKILTDEEMSVMMEEMGMDALVLCPFVPEISGMHAETFVRDILIGRLHAAYVAVGTDFRFGNNREGDAAYLKEHEEEFGFQVDVIEKECFRGREISSTYVREALSEGDMELAGELLGRPYSLEGEVVHGRHIGTTMGMPTANLVPGERKLLPPYGVYYCRTCMRGKEYPGVCNIGRKPTVGDDNLPGAEIHLFEMDRPLYGEYIKTELLHYARPERKFPDLTALKEQIANDISLGREYFGE